MKSFKFLKIYKRTREEASVNTRYFRARLIVQRKKHTTFDLKVEV